MLKKIEAVLRPYKINEIIKALMKFNVFFYLQECKGYGKRLSPLSLYKNDINKSIESLPRVKFSIIAHQENIDQVIKIIIELGNTGIVGDGKIYIESILNEIKIIE